MTVVVKKIGGSVAVVIPKAVARDLNLTEGTPLDVSTSDEGILMRRQGRRARRPIGRIVEQIKSASYRRRNRELSDDAPVGKEIW